MAASAPPRNIAPNFSAGAAREKLSGTFAAKRLF